MTNQTPPTPPIRRIVTGHDSNLNAIVKIDGPATNHKWPPHGMNCSTLIWYADQMPVEIWSDEDFGKRVVERQPVERGARICVIDFEPGCPGMMHRTDTLDYVVCLSGEIDMELDDGASVHMNAGDVMVQQGTNHSWVNNGQTTCRLGFVLLDGKSKPGAGETSLPPTMPNNLTGAPPNPPIRRIVTTHDENGRAIIAMDKTAENHKWSPRGSTSTLIWSSDECPAEIWSKEDYGARKLGTQPPPNGTRFTIMNLPPETPGRMHRTDTLDIIFVMDGKIDMGLDNGTSVTLNKGDVMVQQGTNHSWDNSYKEPCRLAIVLIDGKVGALENTA